MMTPAPKASSYGADGDVNADRFDTAKEKDMMESICTPRSLWNGRRQTLLRMEVEIAEEQQSLTCDSWRLRLLAMRAAGVNEWAVLRVRMQPFELKKGLDPANKESGS